MNGQARTFEQRHGFPRRARWSYIRREIIEAGELRERQDDWWAELADTLRQSRVLNELGFDDLKRAGNKAKAPAWLKSWMLPDAGERELKTLAESKVFLVYWTAFLYHRKFNRGATYKTARGVRSELLKLVRRIQKTTLKDSDVPLTAARMCLASIQNGWIGLPKDDWMNGKQLPALITYNRSITNKSETATDKSDEWIGMNATPKRVPDRQPIVYQSHE